MLRRTFQRQPSSSRIAQSARSIYRRSYATGGLPDGYGPRKGDRVVVAMSGGVDSSVTARLLADKDYNLSAVFMRNWDTRDESGTDKGCEWEKDWEDVQLVCKQIGLPCELIDLTREYWISVFEPSLRAWEAGQTPNPDVWCNREVKFGALMDRVIGLGGAAWLATGHYAGIEWARSPPSFNANAKGKRSNDKKLRPKLVRSADRNKDQTYYLSGVKESSLRKAVFPLQHIPKTEVKELAAKYNLPTAQRKESMGICFVGQKKKFDDFLAEYLTPEPGPIINMVTGKHIATHQGLWRYTLGQSAQIPGQPSRMFVSRKDTTNNRLFVVPGCNHPALYSSAVIVKNFHWIWSDEVPAAIDEPDGFTARAKLRYRAHDLPCRVKRYKHSPDDLVIALREPFLAVTAGQVAALYDEEGRWCLGSGEIVEGIPTSEASPYQLLSAMHRDDDL